MSSLFRVVTKEPVLAGRDRPKVSIVTIKGLIRDAIAELAESPLDGEEYNLVVDAFVLRDFI